AGVDRPTLVMVTFFGLLPQARFSPEDVNITSRGRLFRPVGIVPLSPRWSSYQLDAHEQAVAIYLFEEGISFHEGLTVSYQGLAYRRSGSLQLDRIVEQVVRYAMRFLEAKGALVALAAEGEGPDDAAHRPLTVAAAEGTLGHLRGGTIGADDPGLIARSLNG